MTTLPVLSSSVFNWIGFTGFSSVNQLGIQPSGNQSVFTELCVKSARTGDVVAFKFINRVWSSTGETVSYVYEGWTSNQNQITLIIRLADYQQLG